MMQTHRGRLRTGLSLVEVIVSTLLVGVVMVGALNCVGALIRGSQGTGESGGAQQLASQLMAEILEHDYQELIETPVFGLEPSESGGVRTDWDDVDDYHLWSASPPVDRTGTALTNLTSDWQRDVVVEWVDPNNPANLVGSEQGVKRVTVTVQRGGHILAQQVAVRSNGYTP